MKNSDQKILGWLCLLSPFIFLIISRCVQFNGLYGQDGHEYLHLTKSIRGYFETGNFAQQSSFPLAYPFFGWLFSKTGMDDVFSLQLISAFSLLVAIIYLKRLIGLIQGDSKNTNLFIFLFFILSPYAIRFSVLVMSDMLAMALLLICVFHALNYAAHFKARDLLILNCTGIFAVETRFACFIPLTILFFYILSFHVKKKTIPSALQILIAILPTVILLVVDFSFRHELLFWKLENGRLALTYALDRNSWSIAHFFQSHFLNADGTQQYVTWNILQVWNNVWHPAFLFCGIPFLIFTRKKDFDSPQKRLLLILILIYAFFIAGLPYQNNRYQLLTFPFVLAFLFPAFQRISDHARVIFARRIYPLIILMVIFAAQVMFFILSFQSIYELNQTEQQIAASIKTLPDRTVYTASMNGALANYDVKNKIIDLMQTKISSVDSNSLLLVNANYFSAHWKDQNPMVNLTWIEQHFHLSAIENFEQGWTLYEIKP